MVDPGSTDISTDLWNHGDIGGNTRELWSGTFLPGIPTVRVTWIVCKAAPIPKKRRRLLSLGWNVGNLTLDALELGLRFGICGHNRSYSPNWGKRVFVAADGGVIVGLAIYSETRALAAAGSKKISA